MSGTTVDIENGVFLVDGAPVYAGIPRIEGLLMNARLVQGVFDDLNPETRPLWNYPDGPWDPDRNTAEFLAAMPDWRRAGLAAFTINFQGGSPQGYSREQPWANPAFEEDGRLRPDYAERMDRILQRADDLGFVVILGFFYFGQVGRLRNDAAVLRAADEATDWLLSRGHSNVLIEIANEIGAGEYGQGILRPDRCHELVRRVQERSEGKVENAAGRLLVSASLPGGALPPPPLLEAVDFVLLHGNGLERPDRMRSMIRRCRKTAGWRGQPIVVNEDDHYDFDRSDNNLLAAVDSGAGWGYFDYRRNGEGYPEGFQSIPVDWRIRSARKRAFFGLLASWTGGRLP